jgi:hypothetical protein
VHRRPPVTVAPPPELVSFDPSEWPAEEWWQSCELWGRARMAWVKAHPCSSFGTALDVLREQHRLYEARRRSEWEAGLNGLFGLKHGLVEFCMGAVRLQRA